MSAAPTIESVLKIQRQFEVSTEAVLLRVIRLTDQPTAVFAGARADPTDFQAEFRIDYLHGSPSWAGEVVSGETFNSPVLRQCAAIGHTAIGVESWDGDTLQVEAVGIPPYPGHLFPRVAGLLKSEIEESSNKIQYVRGSALEPRGEENKIVAFVVNDATSAWGGPSFAAQVGRKWPQAQAEFHRLFRQVRGELGRVLFLEGEKGLLLAPMIAQHGYGSGARRRLAYSALNRGLNLVAQKAEDLEASVHLPRLGAGQAGGEWPIVRDVIADTLLARGRKAIVYVLPDSDVFPEDMTPIEGIDVDESRGESLEEVSQGAFDLFTQP